MTEHLNYHYNKNLKGIAKALRKQYSPGEKKLWKEVLCSGKMLGYGFTRQRAIDNYVADFFCKDLNLLIEIDGLNHDLKVEEDKERDKKIARLGYETLRLTHYNIMTDIENVARVIERVKGLVPKVHPPT